MTAIYQLKPSAAIREVAGEIFVVTEDRAFHHAHVPTAIDALAALRESSRTLDELVELIAGRYNVEPDQARADLTDFLATLEQRRIVQTTAA